MADTQQLSLIFNWPKYFLKQFSQNVAPLATSPFLSIIYIDAPFIGTI